MIPTISEELQKEIQIDIEKLKYIKNYYEWLERLVDVFEDQKIFDLVPIMNDSEMIRKTDQT